MQSIPTIGLSSDLCILAIFTFIVCFLVAHRFLSLFTAIAVSALKTLIPFLYFGFFFNPQWLLSDDVIYWTSGIAMIEAGLDPFTIFGSKGTMFLIYESGGYHVLYPLLNFLAQYFFGPHYFAPVFMNIIASVVAGLYLYRTMRELDFDSRQSKFVSIFFMFDAQVLVWSSFLNLKDVLVMTLTIISLYFEISIMRQFSWRALLGLALMAFFWVFLRFYVPVFLVAASVAYSLMSLKVRNLILIFASIAAAGLYLARHSNVFSVLEPTELTTGIVHFLVAPIPWQVEDNYSFLILPALIHWILLPMAALQAVKIWKTNRRARLLLIYFAIVVLAFAVTPEVRGPRHRLQLLPILAMLQYSFIWNLLPRRRLSPTAEPV